MALTAVDFVDADLTTVTYALMSSDGSANSSWGSTPTKFALGGNMKLDVPHDAERFQHPNADGAFTTFSRRGLGTCSFTQVITASSEANLRLGVGRLIDLVTRGGILRITAGVTRYLRFEPSPYPTPFQGKEVELHDIYQQFAFRQGLEVVLHCQPYLEGPEVTGSAVSTPNDPASGASGVRVYPITVSGDLPTPAKVRVQVDATARTLSTSAAADDIIDCTSHGFSVGDAIVFTSLTGGAGLTAGTTYFVTATSFAANTFRPAATPTGAAINFTTDITAGTVKLAGTVQRVLVANRPRNTRASTYFSTYLSDTGYLNCESSGRNWTISLGTDTTSQADTAASGGNVARVTHNTNAATMQRRVRATRTTNLDSLRGAWDVWLRLRSSASTALHEAQLRWGVSAADPVAHTEPAVEHDAANDVASATLGYSEIKLGRITIPETVALGGLALEVWTRNPQATTEDLDLDLVWLSPAGSTAILVVPGGFEETEAGSGLGTGTGVAQITGDPAWGSGTVSGSQLRLNAANEAGGLGPAAGTTYGAGRHVFTLRKEYDTQFTGTLEFRVVNVTDDIEEASVSEVVSGDSGVGVPKVLRVEGVAGKAYQAQVNVSAYTSGNLDVISIAHTFTPYLALNDSARSEPALPAVHRLDSSANLSGYLGSEGVVPATLDPGDNHVMVRCDEVPLPYYTDPENQLERNPTVTVSYFPRYGF